ncbi:ABC transporter ATP-binding protein [uncultured Georgenia sp.]|uniref:ABC transporter ATP-binding protein n=1 Tax=uncultured Georgenia sp. TaxID=378209 RepID=UPI00261376E6|nr:ABC transporter ATP-binding protein [uncultured Georgenia sp.]HLV04511.1 ABC transporter ATP-binding protein [Actinomycetaceae bacterium]
MLELTDVSKTFFAGTPNERLALQGISLRLAPGEFTTVIGSNGAGKSTMLNVIAGKLPPDAGTVTVDGADVTRLPDFRRAAHIGRVFQDPLAGTAPDMTIEENLAIAYQRGKPRGLRLGVTRAKREFFRTELASLELGLEDRLKMKVGLLSGGQRQALSLLMATFSEPKILLLDEHTAALDPQRAELITRLTAEAVERHHLTTLMVTHNMEQALRVGTRLIMMHDGKVVVDIAGERKQRATVQDLLRAFEQVKGAELDDRTLLQ